MSQNAPCCAACQFWDSAAPGDRRECRRHAPQFMQIHLRLVPIGDARNNDAVWPLTMAGHWCGDFQAGKP